MTAIARNGARSEEGRAPAIRLDRVSKRYQSVGALHGLSLEVGPGEFFSLLGPSGCGKTTTLRIIAGLIEPDEGRVYLQGTDVTGLPPYKRNIGLVFQNYALFPHMTVWDNVAYGLRARRFPESEIKARVERYLDLVGLGSMGNRRPRELSGGQQQRVALARSLAIEPVVLLFDEPLSNLDAKLREQMQVEIRQLQRELGFTAFYVTHDQTEALLLSDRLAVLKNGRLEQLGTPEELYEEPASPFIANFLGRTNLLDGIAVRQGDRWLFKTPGGSVIPAGRFVGRLADGGPARLSVRPQRLKVNVSSGEQLPEDGVRLSGIIEERLYLGDRLEYRIRLASGERVAAFGPTERASGAPGDAVTVAIPAAACTLFGAEA
ncbi:MAG: ABC transporter ATP-binding protein [Firmicutes bacterium]|nr:ABC transporter ATP-binding protein [Bacillota bacterium]